MLKIDSKMLVDSFIYEEFESGAEWGEDRYDLPINIEKVRIDRTTVYSRDKTQTQIVAESVIFCYANATTPFKAFKEQSRVTFDGKQYIVKKVIPIKEPFRDVIWSYELEVI